MLADGIDPIGAKNQAKTNALIKGRTFESVALGWHTEMSAKWAPDYSKTVMSRLKTHLFTLIGARAIVDLDTHDLMQPLEAIKNCGTVDIALRVQNYLRSIMREAKRLRLITVNPAYDLVGSIKASRVVHRPALSLSRLPELQERIDTYKGRALTRLTVLLSLHVFVRSSELRFARWSEFDLKRGAWGNTRYATSVGRCTLFHKGYEDGKRYQILETNVRKHGEQRASEDGVRHQIRDLWAWVSFDGLQRTDRVRFVDGHSHRAADEPQGTR